MKSEISRITHEQQTMKEKIKVSIHLKVSTFGIIQLVQENAEKIKVFRVLPYLVSNVVEVSDIHKVFKMLFNNDLL